MELNTALALIIMLYVSGIGPMWLSLKEDKYPPSNGLIMVSCITWPIWGLCIILYCIIDWWQK